MITRMLVFTIVSLAAGPVALAQPFDDGFARDDLSAYVQNASQLKPGQVALEDVQGAAGEQSLRMKDGAEVVFEDVPVEPHTKYALTFRGRYDGGEAVEENPRLDIFTAYRGVPRILPRRELRFLDAEKNPISSLTTGMPFRNWRTYRDIFYPPADAAFLRLVITSGRSEITYFLEDLELEAAPDEGAINVNPVISKHGKHNYSGWGSPAAGGKIIELADGRIVFDTKYGTRGKSFPLSEPGTYSLSAKSEGNGYNSVIILDFLDENGEKIEAVDMRGYGAPRYFVLPEGTQRGRFLVYSNLLEEVRVNRVGDADEIDQIKNAN